MGWSVTIANIGGTAIRLHITFLLFVTWIWLAYLLAEGAAAALVGIIFILLLFGCILLHEFGHIVAARHFGIRTPDVLLLPIGGVARLERLPERPRDEIVVALAGPIVSLVIGGVLTLLALSLWDKAEAGSLGVEILIGQLGVTNLGLALFNLLPAFPMDGGRVLKALLVRDRGPVEATRIAAGAGQLIAFVLGLIGLAGGQAFLVFVALFIFVAASAESGEMQRTSALAGLKARDLMVRQMVVLAPDETLADAADALVRTSQHEFPIVDPDGTVRGLLGRNDLVRALRESGSERPLREVMKVSPSVPASSSAEAALKLLDGGTPAVAVLDDAKHFAGLVTRDNVGEWLLLLDARAKLPANVSVPRVPRPA